MGASEGTELQSLLWADLKQTPEFPILSCTKNFLCDRGGEPQKHTHAGQLPWDPKASRVF